MGGKSKRKGYTSKSVIGGLTAGVKSAMREARGDLDQLLNKQKAWKKGQNPWLTVASSSKKEKDNRPFERVRANDYWGKPGGGFTMKAAPEA